MQQPPLSHTGPASFLVALAASAVRTSLLTNAGAAVAMAVLQRRNFRREMEDEFMTQLKQRLGPRTTATQGSFVLCSRRVNHFGPHPSTSNPVRRRLTKTQCL